MFGSFRDNMFGRIWTWQQLFQLHFEYGLSLIKGCSFLFDQCHKIWIEVLRFSKCPANSFSSSIGLWQSMGVLC